MVRSVRLGGFGEGGRVIDGAGDDGCEGEEVGVSGWKQNGITKKTLVSDVQMD